jgi:type VI secretion system protein ImpF
MTSRRNDRLAPPLMHAFRAAHRERDAALPVDIREQGERVLAPRRVTTRAPITEAELRRLVGSDISALLNTINLASAEDLTDAPEVRKSILNFGFPDLTGISIAENRVFGVAKLLETALRDFEPRLAPGSIKIRRDETVSAEELRVRFLVSAELRVEPVDVPMEFVAELELDSGKIKIDRL